jgi:hypothetical protein
MSESFYHGLVIYAAVLATLTRVQLYFRVKDWRRP